MRGTRILLVFFTIFTSACLLIPSPMFPGNVICALIGETARGYSSVLASVFNGLFYGLVLWLVFVGISRKFEEE